mgnify:FL=1
MSANNYSLIQETTKGFEVSMRDADNDKYSYGAVKIYKSLKTAIKKAQEEETEYGLHFSFLK